MIHAQNSATTIDSSKPFSIEFSFIAKEPLKTGYFLAIKDESRRPVLLLSSGHLQGKEFAISKGKHVVRCEVASTSLASGRYSVDCGLLYPNKEVVDLVEDALFFTVTNSDPFQVGFDYSQQWGAYSVGHKWEMQ